MVEDSNDTVSGRGSGAPAGGRTMKPQDILIDTGPARQILSLWKSTARTGSGDGRSRDTAARIATAPAYRAMRGFLRDQFMCITTDEEVARAIELPDSGICGFGLDPAYQDQDSIGAVLDELEGRGDALRTRIASRVARYLPAGGPWRKTIVWFVISSQSTFDAVTFDPERAADSAGGPVVLVNATDVLSYGNNTRERVDALEHVLAHELFHAGMRVVEAGLPGWAPYRTPSNEVAFIAKAMLDEGIAHYVDWRDRPGSDSLFTWKPSAREANSFSRLAGAVNRIRRPETGRTERMEVMEMAVAGPLWGKYGAISGMFAAHRIEAARGRDALRQAVAGGPAEFLRVYREVAARNPRLSRIPRELSIPQ
jgi:Putative zinc dependent peptidase (DUF5700)